MMVGETTAMVLVEGHSTRWPWTRKPCWSCWRRIGRLMLRSGSVRRRRRSITSRRERCCGASTASAPNTARPPPTPASPPRIDPIRTSAWRSSSVERRRCSRSRRPEGEPAQERAQRRRRPHVGEQSAHRTVPQQRHVIDRVRAGHHPANQRGDLRRRVRADRHMRRDQAMQPGPLSQRQHRRKTAVRHEVPVVEHRRDAVTDSYLLDALPLASNRSLDKIDSVAAEGHSGSTTRASPQEDRWIRA